MMLLVTTNWVFMMPPITTWVLMMPPVTNWVLTMPAVENCVLMIPPITVVPGHPLREVVCYTHAIAAASGATGSDSPYSIVTTR
jgi:hypothetical protein